MKLVLLQSHYGKTIKVNSLQIGNSYNLKGMHVREYNGKRYLSTAFDGSVFESIDDIPDILNSTNEDSAFTIQYLQGAKIVGVIDLEQTTKCMNCGHKLVSIKAQGEDCGEEQFVECVKCKIKDFCESSFSAQLLINATSPNVTITLSAYETILKQLASPHPITRATLLKSPKIDLSFKDDHIRGIHFCK